MNLWASLMALHVKKESEVAQWCPTLCNPKDCRLPGYSVHGIFQGRVDCHFLHQGIFRPRVQTQFSYIAGRQFTIWATREAPVGKESACNAGDNGHTVRSLEWEDPLEESMATHSSILAWRISRATVHSVAKSRTWLKQLSTAQCTLTKVQQLVSHSISCHFILWMLIYAVFTCIRSSCWHTTIFMIKAHHVCVSQKIEPFT